MHTSRAMQLCMYIGRLDDCFEYYMSSLAQLVWHLKSGTSTSEQLATGDAEQLTNWECLPGGHLNGSVCLKAWLLFLWIKSSKVTKMLLWRESMYG